MKHLMLGLKRAVLAPLVLLLGLMAAWTARAENVFFIAPTTPAVVNVCSLTYTPPVDCTIEVTITCVAEQSDTGTQWSTFGDITTSGSVAATDDIRMSRNPSTAIGDDSRSVARSRNYSGVAGVAQTFYFSCISDFPTASGRIGRVRNVVMRLRAFKLS